VTRFPNFCFVDVAAAIGIALSAVSIPAIAANANQENPDPLARVSPLPQELWWSLKPLTKPAVPNAPPGKFKTWPRTSVDQFILAKLGEKGLHPSAVADKHTLLRRVYFDLTGLPPTPEEMSTFLNDRSPNAYEKVVDRLLASPRYGERWARHWLDVVHYADTQGNDQDRPRPNAWPYRDYLIRSFNEDKPYARFVQEQLAGDVLFPDDPQGVVATGFIAAGPWDESSQKFIVEDTVDKKIARNLDRDDMVMTTMSTFVSTTAHCARCHNHKFDPISQTDYYRLQAVFAGVDRAERPYDLESKTHVLRQSLLKQKRTLDMAETNNTRADPADLAAAQSALQKSLEGDAAIWTVLDPNSFISSEGATLTKLDDSSLLASGKLPEKDTYTITAQTALKRVTAVRVEVMSDPSLPHQGPGRQPDNGNLHLSEFQLFASSIKSRGASNNVVLQNATADFNQQDWSIEKSIDKNPATAWGIHPEEGRSHRAYFEFKEPLTNDGGTKLTFVLDQVHGRNHVIGRLRLAVTTASVPVRADRVPYAIAKILTAKEGKRSEREQADLLTLYRRYQIERQLDALPKAKMVFAAANDFTPQSNFTPAKIPRPIYVLKRGDVTRPGDPVGPGTLSCVPGMASEFPMSDPRDEGARRAALAKWITDPKNVLTWRSIVNRVWHYHFGRGIVDTPSDFGHMGSPPTHPELLDWLAATFIESGGSLKQLHRLIVTSAVYMQSSQVPVGDDVRRLKSPASEFVKNQSLPTSSPTELDSDNRYLWRMNRTRLDAESIRDAILQITSKLDLTMGGPSVMQFNMEDPEPSNTPKVDYNQFNVDSPESYRRSIYRFIFRTLPDPFMDCLDCPDSSQLAATRNVSITALQAMALMNDRFVISQSEHFAERLQKASPNLTKQLELAYQLALGRAPTSNELKMLVPYAQKHGLANACRIILNSNEFVFVD
jgi:hypothetical protein